VDYRKFLLAAGLAAAVATPVVAAPVAASNNSNGKALILIPLTLTKVADLEFGTVIESSTSGTVSIPPDGSARTFTGGVVPVASPLPARAQFAGAGTPGQLVNIFLAPPANLKDTNGDLLPISMSLESSNVTIDSTHAFFVGVGGTVTIAANQPDGDYTGTFTVLAQYN
jgi:opacity protein-like surface antigen